MNNSNVVSIDKAEKQSPFIGQQLLKGLLKAGFKMTSPVEVKAMLAKDSGLERMQKIVLEQFSSYAEELGINKFKDNGFNEETFYKVSNVATCKKEKFFGEVGDKDLIEFDTVNIFWLKTIPQDYFEEDFWEKFPEIRDSIKKTERWLYTEESELESHLSSNEIARKAGESYNWNEEIASNKVKIKNYSKKLVDLKKEFEIYDTEESNIYQKLEDMKFNRNDIFKSFLCAVDIPNDFDVVYEDINEYANGLIPDRCYKNIEKAQELGAEKFLVAYPELPISEVSKEDLMLDWKERRDQLKKQREEQAKKDRENQRLLDPVILAVSGKTMFFIDKWI